MTIKQAKSELMQIYGALSPDKQRAIDTLVNVEPCEDCISRKEVLDGIEELKKSPWATDKRGFGFEYLIKEALEVVADLCVKQAPPVNPQEPKTGHWIPVSERLPERAEEGASNWHTDTVMVCMYGNAQYDGYDDFGYEILTGIFEELEDEKTKTKDLCFVPDRFTLFIPDEWDFFVLDKNYETHLPKNECMYLVDDYSDKSEFHDKYFKVLAWMPLPAPYEPQESEDKDADKKCTYKETGCGSCKRQLDCPIEADTSESEDKCKNCEYYRNPDYTRCHECKAESEDKE